MALLNTEQRKESSELMVELLGTPNPNDLEWLVLSNDETLEPKYDYVNGERTDTVNGMSVTLHIAEKGVEVNVKIPDPNFTLKNAGLAELKFARPVNLKVVSVNGNYYWRADNLVPVKKAE